MSHQITRLHRQGRRTGMAVIISLWRRCDSISCRTASSSDSGRHGSSSPRISVIYSNAAVMGRPPPAKSNRRRGGRYLVPSKITGRTRRKASTQRHALWVPILPATSDRSDLCPRFHIFVLASSDLSSSNRVLSATLPAILPTFSKCFSTSETIISPHAPEPPASSCVHLHFIPSQHATTSPIGFSHPRHHDQRNWNEKIHN